MRYRLYFPILVILFYSCGNKKSFLKEVKQLSYPSASGIEYYNKQFYIIGDDAADLLVLDSNFQLADSFQLYTSTTRRIPKNIKPDLEAIAFIRSNDSTRLLITGSGSLSPYRNTAWLIDPVTRQKTTWSLDTFYQRLKNRGLTELNIEGACSIFGGTMALSNRGHKAFPKNHLILTSPAFWANQSDCPITLIRIGASEDSTHFEGVSGMTYSRQSDRLIITVSTEDTRSVLEDGAIGKSYLWIVDNISAKRTWKAINPNRVIDLDETDHRFKGQKIESVCVTKETRHFIYLVLVADNDNGSSALFNLVIEKD